MTCECLTWCRVPEESNTLNGRFPISDHHPNCPEYKAEEFAIVEMDGSFCVCRPSEVADFIDGGEEDQYKITKVMLAPDQVEKLPEFEGF